MSSYVPYPDHQVGQAQHRYRGGDEQTKSLLLTTHIENGGVKTYHHESTFLSIDYYLQLRQGMLIPE